MVKDIHKLELHEKIKVNATTEVMKVEGGWIYLHYDLQHNNWLKQTTFVPILDQLPVQFQPIRKYIPPAQPNF